MSTVIETFDEKRTDTITLAINGKEVNAKKGASVLEAALNAGIYIPTLCYDPDLKSYGACRLCVVEIEGMRGLVSSCTAPATEGMVVHSETPRANQSRRITMELIIANHHGDCLTCLKNQQCELLKIAQYLGMEQEHIDRLRKSTQVFPIDDSHPAFVRDPNKCILCAKCVRACHEIAGVGAIGLAFRGYSAKVTTVGDRPIIESICKSCGECLARCPTGALVPKYEKPPAKEVKTICAYCGVGCSLYLGVRDNKIVSVRGDSDGSVNKGSLCVKGRWGYDFVTHSERLSTPLIRIDGVPRGAPHDGQVHDIFREATWDEALELVSKRLLEIKQTYGPDSFACLSSAKCTNEDNYVMQKFTRAVLGTNNVDHCARLCHASTVVGALAAFGQGAMSNSYHDLEKTDLFFVIGSNTTECHPIIGSIIKRRVRAGAAKLIVADPRSIELSEYATVDLHHQPGTDVALLNGLMQVIIRDGLEDKDFIQERTEGFEEMHRLVKEYTPEVVEERTGVPQSDIEAAAHLFGEAESACILYGMGITQHTTGTDNVKSVANLLMLTGNIGREGTGFSPLRGQNNVQGACDMGALPNVYPGYERVDESSVRAKFEAAWGCELSDRPGFTATEIADAIYRGDLKGLYVMGENPMLSEPYLEHTQRALRQIEFLVVQDIFPSETAWLADVVFPAAAFAEKDGTFTNTERRVQRIRQALLPPGEARADWQITSALAEKMGKPFGYESAADIMEEIASLTPIYGGIHFDRLDKGGLQWPCLDTSHPGTQFLHQGSFARGRGKFHAVDYIPPSELVSERYPLVLTTGRVLEHWHTGTMSRRSEVLTELRPNGAVEMHPDDAAKLGFVEHDLVTLTSERGRLETMLHITEKSPPGVVFMPFHWCEAPANVLTNNALDPVAKIPEFKVCAINAVLAALDRAAEDNAFLARLAENPAEALKEYELTTEERAAIASGDVSKIESWVGKLDERLRTWLMLRLSQEKW
ncbi:MAG: formate dehydrogenase subunit alpha [Dehalococcoidia bacterium]|nr:formate dehydrogenase subunit alpha [Dehalococcoidia bacterium]